MGAKIDGRYLYEEQFWRSYVKNVAVNTNQLLFRSLFFLKLSIVLSNDWSSLVKFQFTNVVFERQIPADLLSF